MATPQQHDETTSTAGRDDQPHKWSAQISVRDLTDSAALKRALEDKQAEMRHDAHAETEADQKALEDVMTKMTAASKQVLQYAHHVASRAGQGSADLEIIEAADGRVQISIAHESGHASSTLVVPYHQPAAPPPEPAAEAPAAPPAAKAKK